MASNISATAPVIKTKRLLLRLLSVEDAPDIFLIRSRPEVMVNTSTGFVETSDEQSREWIALSINNSKNFNFAVELLPDENESESQQSDAKKPKVIGTLGAIRPPEVGYMFNPDYWGKGYATEALQAFMPIFFDHYSGENGYNYAIAVIDPENVGSGKVLQKNNFVLWKTVIGDFESPVLGTRDSIYYYMSRPGTEARPLDDKESVDH